MVNLEISGLISRWDKLNDAILYLRGILTPEHMLMFYTPLRVRVTAMCKHCHRCIHGRTNWFVSGFFCFVFAASRVDLSDLYNEHHHVPGSPHERRPSGRKSSQTSVLDSLFLICLFAFWFNRISYFYPCDYLHFNFDIWGNIHMERLFNILYFCWKELSQISPGARTVSEIRSLYLPCGLMKRFVKAPLVEQFSDFLDKIALLISLSP